MLKKAIGQSWFTRFSLGVILVGALVLLFVLKSERKTFPAIPVGAFVGKISGVAHPANEYRTFYLERTKFTDALLVVVMGGAWKPQYVSTKRSFESVENDQALIKDLPYEELQLKNSDAVFKISGRQFGERYKGEVDSEIGKDGVWQLQPLKGSSQEQAQPLMLDTEEWLGLKAKELRARRKLEEAKAALQENIKKKERFEAFVSDEGMLRERAHEKRVALQEELRNAKAQKDEVTKEVSGLVSELGLLSRITKRGKSVTLARKVAARENKWYLANWRVSEDDSGLGEFLGARSDLNLPQLEHEVKRAQDVEYMVAEIAEEKQKIRELQRQIRYEHAPRQGSTFPSSKEKKQKKKKNLWNRIWGSPARGF